jgi:NAD+ synthase
MKNIEEQIIKFIQRKVKESNTEGIVVGLSGGIDSTVASVLAVKAVGEENVIGVIMPCQSNPQDEQDALLHAKQFNIPTKIVDLETTYFTLKNAINFPGNKMSDANLKPRLRMCTLYNVANAQNYLVLGTCNKSEIKTGYETKFGDGGSDLSPLGDLYKWQVRVLAKHLNIDKKIITKAPSAGLWENQTDEKELGLSYDELDEILVDLELNIMSNTSFTSPEAYQKVKQLIENSKHKREMPEICKII